MLKTRNGNTVLSSKCFVGNRKKSRFIKEQEAQGILSSLGFKTPVSKIPLLEDMVF